MSSPVSELLIQESLCTELFKSISESIGAASQTNLKDISPVSYSDDVGQLLDQMVQILPPEERNIFGFAEEKNIEDIIQEANELIRSTTPLFSSSSDSCEKSGDKALLQSKQAEVLEKSTIESRQETESCSPKGKNDSGSIFSSLESVLIKENVGNISTIIEATSPEQTSNYSDSDCENPHSFDKVEDNFGNKLESLFIDERPEDKNLTTVPINTKDTINKSFMNIAQNKQNLEPMATSQLVSGTAEKIAKENDAEIKHQTNKSPQASSYWQKELEAELEFLKQKHAAELQELNLMHSKEISGLTEHINSLNKKIYEFQKHSKVNKSPDLKDQQLEQLENEIRSQEQLIAGYEKENVKLCKEITNLKETWKQRESKLLEEKQKLQNELQGMVLKSTTEALQEQLKDARETIVKLQIELTTCKTKNKELEGSCERLRGEAQRLQSELSKCQCDRAVGRRDKYSFLASSNIGTQIQELKNVIARKDVEIAQLSTKIGVLKGELSSRDSSLSPYSQQVESQTALVQERQAVKDLAKERDFLFKDNLDLKRQVRELESIVKRHRKTDSVFPSVIDTQTNSRLVELERELSSRQESLSTLHKQFLSMQKKYEEHIQELESRLEKSKEELQSLRINQKKEELNNVKSNIKKLRQSSAPVKEETHLLATIRGLRQEAAIREKEISKLNKEVEEVRQTNRKLQKEREKQLNSMPLKMLHIKEKANLRKMERPNSVAGSNLSVTSTNNNSELNPILLAELQESNLILKSKNKSLQEEVKRLEQDLIAMHNKRVHDLNKQQNEHEQEVSQLIEERAALLSHSSAAELQGQIYTQQMVINHLKNRLKQMEELKSEVTLLRAERDHLEESLAAVNKKMCFLQNAQSPESIQYKTLLEKLEALEKNQEIREQKLSAVRELLSRSTQGQGKCSGTCRDKLLDKNRQICYYRAQMDRILEALLELRRTK